MDCNLKIKLYLEDDNGKFMGIGVLWLLQSIEKNGSLRAAAADLGISYSKAYAMIKNLENAVGKPMIERKKGGQDRSGANLTSFARDFIKLYDSFQSECKYLLDEPFKDFSHKLDMLISQRTET